MLKFERMVSLDRYQRKL